MGQAGREIELKFLCTPQDLSAVLAAAPAGEDEVRELISVYFDTPGRDLEKAGASLRVRESGGRRVQTLKRGMGLAREEHEQPVAGLAPDPAIAPLRELLPEDGAAALRPAFHVRVQRRQRLVRHGSAVIELALDQGEVRGGGRSSAICEVELELKSGTPAALFDLGRELLEAAPLYLSFDSKSAQGQALTAGSTPQARRKARVVLAPGTTAAEAFQAAARNALAQIAGNAQALREAPHPEAVHQLRVAARRFRSALSTFAPIVRDERSEWLKGELRWLAQACDEARNLDVFAEEVLGPARVVAPSPAATESLMAAVATARARATDAAVQAAASPRLRALLLEAAAWVETGGWLDDPARSPARGELAEAFAAHALEARRKKLAKRGRRLAVADDEARHELRIQAKKLRYAAEALASLYPGKRAERFIGRLKTLQEELGALNDMAVAEAVAAKLELTPEAAFAAGELVGLKAAEAPRRIAAAAEAFERLTRAKPFWRT